jgi:hypothetical protein
VKNQLVIEVYMFRYYAFYAMNGILFSYSRFSIVFFTLLSLMLNSVVFSLGNKKSIKEIIKPDSIISNFFSINGISDEIIKNMMADKTAKKNGNGQNESSPINKEISIVMLAVGDAYFEEEEFGKQIFNDDKIVNFSINREIRYPLKIPFDRDLIVVMMLFGLIFMGLARSVPVILKIKFKELILRSESISSFYLLRVYEKF